MIQLYQHRRLVAEVTWNSSTGKFGYSVTVLGLVDHLFISLWTHMSIFQKFVKNQN